MAGLTLANADELIGWGIDEGYEGRKSNYGLLQAIYAEVDRPYCSPDLFAGTRSQSLPDRRGGAEAIDG